MTKSLRRKGFSQKNRKSRKQRVSRKRHLKGGYLKELSKITLKNPFVMLGLSDDFLENNKQTLETLNKRTIIRAYLKRSKELHPDKHVGNPDDMRKAREYFQELTNCKERLLTTLALPNARKIDQLTHWKNEAAGSKWINWPFNKEMPKDEDVTKNIGEILQLTNGSATVHDDADEDDAEDVEYHVEPDVPTNYNAIVSNLSKEQKKWIKEHYEKILAFSSSVPKGLNDYNEILKEIFKFYNL